ncbi:hypothetical protein GCM10027168_30970 [Streptomyces capparidis]
MPPSSPAATPGPIAATTTGGPRACPPPRHGCFPGAERRPAAAPPPAAPSAPARARAAAPVPHPQEAGCRRGTTAAWEREGPLDPAEQRLQVLFTAGPAGMSARMGGHPARSGTRTPEGPSA